MIEVIYLLVFFLCLASVTGSVLLAQKLKSVDHKGTFESLLYYVILISFFGIYGIWGQVIILYILTHLSASPDIIQVICHLIPLFGFPFLIMGGYMLIKFMYELWGEKISRATTAVFFILYLLLLVIFGWFSFHEFPYHEVKFINSLILLILFFTIQETGIQIWFLVFHLKKMNQHDLSLFTSYVGKFVILFLFFLVIKIILVIGLVISQIVTPVFIFFYFFSLVIPVFFLYKKHVHIIYEVQPDYQSFDDQDLIFKRNGVSKREREVIELICAGKTNQEIADLLFITLQTVKDHTHRIYLKLDVKNRMQLIHLLHQN